MTSANIAESITSREVWGQKREDLKFSYTITFRHIRDRDILKLLQPLKDSFESINQKVSILTLNGYISLNFRS